MARRSSSSDTGILTASRYAGPGRDRDGRYVDDPPRCPLGRGRPPMRSNALGRRSRRSALVRGTIALLLTTSRLGTAGARSAPPPSGGLRALRAAAASAAANPPAGVDPTTY